MHELWEPLEYVGETLVFLGVVGEVYVEWRKPERERLGKLSSIVLIIGLAVSLASLIGTNENFNATIADLNQEAAKLRLRAEDEAAKRVSIEELLAWRTLSPGQEKQLSAHVPRSLIGTELPIAYVAGDAEGAVYASAIARCLKSAGWTVPWVNGAEFNGMVPSGIELWVNREYPAAHSLQGILANAGLHPRLKPDAGMVSGTMILFVGVKPHPNK